MSGTIVFSSIGDAENDDWNPGQDSVDGQSFTSLSGSTVITGLQFGLGDSSPGDGGHVVATLWSDSGTAPHTQVATLGTIADVSLSSGSAATVSLTVSGGPTLTASTRYWIELTASSAGNVFWGATDSTVGNEVSSQFQDSDGSVAADSGNEAFLMSVTTHTACFAGGTRILTLRGEVAVESLREGDQVVTARAGGRLAPVRWIGRRHLSPARHPRPWDVNPIRIRAGAIGPGRPSRDLLLSPDHALFLDGILVRARDLLNGATIVQEDVAQITYYHVELDRHDALLAEGVAAESFLDTGNRGAFQNGGAPVQVHPAFSRAVWARDAFAPLVWEGPQVAAVRQKLAARAGQVGWTLTDQADLCVIAGGRSIRPTIESGTWTFELPADTQVVLRSRTTVPAYVMDQNIDTRTLGVGVTRLALDGAALPLDGEAFGGGWLAAEAGLRWTQGEATLRTGGARRLEVGLAGLLRYWVAPEMAMAA